MTTIVLGLAISYITIIASMHALRRPHGLSLVHSARLLGWVFPALSLGACTLGLLDWLEPFGLEPSHTLATLLPPITALQAAFIFSPEDEPAIEITLAAARPSTWTVLERFGIVISLHGLIGLGLSLAQAASTGDYDPDSVFRWASPLIVLAALSVCITLITRRAIFAIALVSLLWFAALFLGEWMIDKWPFAWPIHLYLEADHTYFWINRLFLALSGAGIMVYSLHNLLRDDERLLLGNRRAKMKPESSTQPELNSVVSLSQPVASIHPALWSQILGMTRYELLMHRRRTTFGILLTCLLIFPILNAVLGSSQLAGLAESVAVGGVTPDYARAVITNSVMLPTWLGLLGVSWFLVVVLVADSVPRDRQVGVGELLQSLPLPSFAYLLGKLVSVWASLVIALGLAAGLSTLVNYLVLGPFDVAVYLEMWFVGGGAMLLTSSAFGLLIGATQPSNRRAVMMAVLFAILSQGLAVIGFLNIHSSLSHWLPTRPALTMYYLFGYPHSTLGPNASSSLNTTLSQLTSQPAALLDIAAGFVEVVIVFGLVWWWLKRKQVQ